MRTCDLHMRRHPREQLAWTSTQLAATKRTSMHFTIQDTLLFEVVEVAPARRGDVACLRATRLREVSSPAHVSSRQRVSSRRRVSSHVQASSLRRVPSPDLSSLAHMASLLEVPWQGQRAREVSSDAHVSSRQHVSSPGLSSDNHGSSVFAWHVSAEAYVSSQTVL